MHILAYFVPFVAAVMLGESREIASQQQGHGEVQEVLTSNTPKESVDRMRKGPKTEEMTEDRSDEWCAKFYKDSNYEGDVVTVKAGQMKKIKDEDSFGIEGRKGSEWNDKISSLKVNKGRVYFSTAYFQISGLVWQPLLSN